MNVQRGALEFSASQPNDQSGHSTNSMSWHINPDAGALGFGKNPNRVEHLAHHGK